MALVRVSDWCVSRGEGVLLAFFVLNIGNIFVFSSKHRCVNQQFLSCVIHRQQIPVAYTESCDTYKCFLSCLTALYPDFIALNGRVRGE